MPFIAASGLSWWEALYEDGRSVGEWDSLVDTRRLKLPSRAEAGSSRWEELPREGLRGLRLIGPTGEVADLRSDSDHKFFQFKQGIAVLSEFDRRRVGGNHRQAHVIGVVVSSQGDCVCFAWEHEGQRGEEIPYPGRMIGPFTDKIGVGIEAVQVGGVSVKRPDGMNYRQIGPLSLENLGLKL